MDPERWFIQHPGPPAFLGTNWRWRGDLFLQVGVAPLRSIVLEEINQSMSLAWTGLPDEQMAPGALDLTGTFVPLSDGGQIAQTVKLRGQFTVSGNSLASGRYRR